MASSRGEGRTMCGTLNNWKLILISGSPASGKSNLANTLQSALDLERIGKDDIIEADQHLSAMPFLQRERVVRRRIEHRLNEACATGTTTILDLDVIPLIDRRWLRRACNRWPEVREIYLLTSGHRILCRFVRRNEAGERSAIHRDRRWYPTIVLYSAARLLGFRFPWTPLTSGSSLLVVRTDDFSSLPTAGILRFLAETDDWRPQP